MTILVYEDLVELVDAGKISGILRDKIAGFSLDVLFEDIIYKPLPIKGDVLVLNDDESSKLSDAKFLEQCCTPVVIPREGLIIQEGDFYLAKLRPEIAIDEHFTLEMRTRSSYARRGLIVESLGLGLLARESSAINTLFSLRTRGTTAIVPFQEEICQLFVRPNLSFYGASQIKPLVDSGELIVRKDGFVLEADEINYNYGITLSIDPIIHVYKKGIVLGKANKVENNILINDSSAFTTVDLREYPEGYFLNHKSFFLSACAEEIEIAPKYVGFVTESVFMQTAEQSRSEVNYFPSLPFLTHSNAPYHGHRNMSKGKVTFENYVVYESGVLLFAGAQQSELLIHPLSRESGYTKKSRYDGQVGATKEKRPV